MITIERALLDATKSLSRAGIEQPRLESEFLFASFFKVSRTRLILDRAKALPKSSAERLRVWLKARTQRKPLAYVSGEQAFREFSLKVNPDVLIPRPETELLVEQAMRILDRASQGCTVVDVGTGSGNIAIALAGHARTRRVYGIDISKPALSVARRNAKRVHRGAPIRWLHGNLLVPVQRLKESVDLVVANLPYVRTQEMHDLEPELHWEPRRALDGGRDGLKCIAPCIEQAGEVVRPGGSLLLEFGFDQSKDVVALLKDANVWEDIVVYRDLAGLPRFLHTVRRGK